MTNIDQTAQSVLNQCINLLARFPKTEYETRQKIADYIVRQDSDNLLSKNDKELITEKVIATLKESNLINDEEYILSFVRGNNNSIKPDGSLLVIKKMRQKGIPSDVLSTHQEVIRAFDQENAQKLAQKKLPNFSTFDELSQKDKQKLASYLASRGFSYDVINSLGSEIAE